MVSIVIIPLAWMLAWRHQGHRDIVAAGSVPSLMIASSGFADGGTIPPKYTCDGADISPQLAIAAPPPRAAKSLVLIAEDPDAPGGTFVHWVVFNLPAALRELPEGSSVTGSVEGKNDFNKTGYGGPCPPSGRTHHYIFRVYALDTSLVLHEGANRAEVVDAAKGHVVAEGKLTGLYRRGQ